MMMMMMIHFMFAINIANVSHSRVTSTCLLHRQFLLLTATELCAKYKPSYLFNFIAYYLNQSD